MAHFIAPKKWYGFEDCNVLRMTTFQIRPILNIQSISRTVQFKYTFMRCYRDDNWSSRCVISAQSRSPAREKKRRLRMKRSSRACKRSISITRDADLTSYWPLCTGFTFIFTVRPKTTEPRKGHGKLKNIFSEPVRILFFIFIALNKIAFLVY